MNDSRVEEQILRATQQAGKTYSFNDAHDSTTPIDWWFQQSDEGLILFAVFFTQACRWSRCAGCNLPSLCALHHVDFRALMKQIDRLFAEPEIERRRHEIRKVIISNNGSVLDEQTFSSLALMYLMAKLNLHLPNMQAVSMEARAEYVDVAEVEFLSRALKEREVPAELELAIGFEVFDDHIRNRVFRKGLSLRTFERLVRRVAKPHIRLKCYFMLKPVPDMTDAEAVADVHQAIEYLSSLAEKHNTTINMHLNPTYVARGTPLEAAFRAGKYTPPDLLDVARAARHGRGRRISLFIGLSDEGLAVPGGSFNRPGSEKLAVRLEQFNRTQDYSILDAICEERDKSDRSPP